MAAAFASPDPLAWRAPRACGHDAQHFDAPPRIPGYKLLRPIGAGRRSVAWLAFDEARRCDVVVKLQAGDADALRRDADIAARVQGPQLVRVHAQGRTGAWSYLVLEHVPGGDLAQRLRTRVPRAVALRRQRDGGQAL
jgi:serine/threonine protein kinase